MLCITKRQSFKEGNVSSHKTWSAEKPKDKLPENQFLERVGLQSGAKNKCWNAIISVLKEFLEEKEENFISLYHYLCYITKVLATEKNCDRFWFPSDTCTTGTWKSIKNCCVSVVLTSLRRSCMLQMLIVWFARKNNQEKSGNSQKTVCWGSSDLSGFVNFKDNLKMKYKYLWKKKELYVFCWNSRFR